MIDSFLIEFESQITSFKDYKKWGEILLKYSPTSNHSIHFQECIAFDPIESNKYIKKLCELADKHKVTITGTVKPFSAGPAITQQESFFIGMKKERLLKWYAKYGFMADENDNVKREPI